MAKLNQLAIDSKSELLSEQVLLYVEREMDRELRMTRILTDLCHEVTDAVKDKVKLIEKVKELGVAAQVLIAWHILGCYMLRISIRRRTSGT
ncbi:hypothetical protein Tco_0569216 [Tanacetum coccineum]